MTDEQVCVKLFKKDEDDDIVEQSWKREMKMVDRGLDHPNVLKTICGAYS